MRQLASPDIRKLLVLALPLLAPAAVEAGLMIDLRLPTGDPKGIAAVTPGQKVPIDIYAVVTGTAAGVEGFQSVQGAVIGSGDLAGRILPAGDLDEATSSITLPALAPYNGNGAQRGESKHIGRTDAIVDLGDEVNRGDDLGNLIVFRANSMQVNSGTVIPNGREFKIGRAEYVVDGNSGAFSINFAFRRGPSGEPQASAALFRQDGAVGNGLGDISVGAPITIAPEPTALAWVALAGVIARRRPGFTRVRNAGVTKRD